MSIKVMTRVWELSQHAGNDLLMLLAIADFAGDDGRAYPAISTLAKKCRMTPRNVNLILAELRKSGELQVRQNEGPKGTNMYVIHLDALKESSPLKDPSPLKDSSSTPEGFFPIPLKVSSDEPSVNHHEPSLLADEPPVSSKAADRCPHQEILNVWAEILPTCRQPKAWTPTRKNLLRARWQENPKRQSLDWWRRFFAYLSESDFLMGRSWTPGRSPFDLGLDWLLKTENFAKAIEGGYHREAAQPSPKSIHDQRSATIAALTGYSATTGRIGDGDILEGRVRVIKDIFRGCE